MMLSAETKVPVLGQRKILNGQFIFPTGIRKGHEGGGGLKGGRNDAKRLEGERKRGRS